MEQTPSIQMIMNFLSQRSPAEYTLATSWAVSEVLGLMKNTKVKSLLGLLWNYGKAIYKAVKEVEVLANSEQGKAVISEVKKDLNTTTPPTT
jgi:hypothetical protein